MDDTPTEGGELDGDMDDLDDELGDLDIHTETPSTSESETQSEPAFATEEDTASSAAGSKRPAEDAGGPPGPATQETTQLDRELSEQTPDGRIGHVIASNEIRIASQTEESRVEVFITSDARPEVRVEDYVEIPYPDGDTHLFGVIKALRYRSNTHINDTRESHSEIAQEIETNENKYSEVAEIEPIAQLTEETDPATDDDARNVTQNIVNRIPKPNEVTRLSRDDLRLRAGLQIPAEGVFAGFLSVGGDRMQVDGKPVPYYLASPTAETPGGEDGSGIPAIFRHGLIAGVTGTGKTHYSKNLLRQLHDTGYYELNGETDRSRAQLNTVIFDPEAEYPGLRNDNPTLTAAQRSELQRNGIQFGGLGDDLRVYYPNVEQTGTPSVGKATPVGIPFSIVAQEPRLLMPDSEMSEQTRHGIRDTINRAFDAHGPELTYEQYTQYVQTQPDEGPPGTDMHSRTWSAVKRRTTRGSVYSSVFDNGTQMFTDMTDELFDPGTMTVIPTSHLTGPQEELAVLALLSYIINNKITDYNVDENVKHTPMLVAVDEAHNYLSAPTTPREAHIVNLARRAAKQGRKEQLGLFGITQNPDDIDEGIISQMNTNVFLSLDEEQARDVAAVPREYTTKIGSFGQGQAVVRAPDVTTVEIVGLPYCVVAHEGN